MSAKAAGVGQVGRFRPERQVIEVRYEATARTFTAVVEECTGANAPGQRLAEWSRERETPDSPLLEAHPGLEAHLGLEPQPCSK